MDRRREMARRLGPVLLVVVVIAALVGVFARDGFGEGDTLAVVEEGGGEETGKPLWRDVVDVVSAFAVIVIGAATLYVMFRQKRLGQRQMAWEREFGERQERLMLGDRKYKVVEALGDFILRIDEGVEAEDLHRLALGGFGKMFLFGEKEQEWVGEFCRRAGELEQVGRGLRKKELEGVERDKLDKKRKELVKWFVGSADEVRKLMRGCWGGGAGNREKG